MLRIRYAGAVYREAGTRDIAHVLATMIFPWIYKLGLARERVIEWLENLSCNVPVRQAEHPYIPEELKLQVCRMLATTGMLVGDVVTELIREIEDNPPPGFRWKKDKDTGDVRLERHSYKGKEKPLHRGLKFEGMVFVGCWWSTDKPSSSPNRKIQSLLRANDGGVFFKLRQDPYTEYFGYAIVPVPKADGLGEALDDLCKSIAASDHGTGSVTESYRLSAAYLDALAERRQPNPGDIHTLTGVFKSNKYNHEINLTDLLLGRVSEFKSSIQDILRKYEG